MSEVADAEGDRSPKSRAPENGSRPAPPRPHAVLRVGVIGHRPDEKKRPNPDEAKIRATVREILRHVMDGFESVSRAEPGLFQQVRDAEIQRLGSLRIISSLAEGADQWVAEEALALGYKLQCPLPFPCGMYKDDFPDAAKTFEPLIEQAVAVLQMDGTRSDSGRSYQAAGWMVLRQSDLLIAVWDGEPEQGVGGTGEMVQEALARGIPTVWIRWSSAEERPDEEWKLLDFPWRVLEKREELDGDWARLTDVVNKLLMPPQIEESDRDARSDSRLAYFHEGPPSSTVLGGWWKLLRDAVSGKLREDLGKKGLIACAWSHIGDYRSVDVLAATRDDWANAWTKKADRNTRQDASLPDAVKEWVDRHFLEHYAWANQLSIFHSNLYRSAFVVTYLLGALAVFLALVGVAFGLQHREERWPIGAELLVIAMILLLTWHGRRKGWHSRSIDYRTLAERLRVSRFLVLLGGGGQQTTVPGHLATYGNPAGTWMHWHYRAIERAAGLPNAVIDQAYLAGCREVFLESLIEDQKDYHHKTARWLETIDRRLHRVGTGFFAATFVACAIHFGLALLPKQAGIHGLGGYLTLLNAFLPAMGSALTAIRNQGEFQRVAQRSRAMHEKLTQLKVALANVPDRERELHSLDLRRIATETAQLMVNEELDWRIVFQDRPPSLPA